MLRKSKNLISYSLFSLLAVLFIAIGMPLVHPVLHQHLDHRHIHADGDVKHLATIQDDEKDRECSICDFLATYQLHSSGLGLIITANEWVGRVAQTHQIFLVQIGPFSAKSRAPPASILL